MIFKTLKYLVFLFLIWVFVIIVDIGGLVLLREDKNLGLVDIFEVWSIFGVDNIIIQTILHLYLIPINILFGGLKYESDFKLSTFFLIAHGALYFVTYLWFLAIKRDLQYYSQEKKDKT